jgi:hypothetical protein
MQLLLVAQCLTIPFPSTRSGTAGGGGPNTPAWAFRLSSIYGVYDLLSDKAKWGLRVKKTSLYLAVL